MFKFEFAKGRDPELGGYLTEEQDFKHRVTQLREMFLDIVTRRKYRILTSIYTIFRLSDNVILIVLILNAIFHSEMDEALRRNAEIFAVFSVDVFHSYLDHETKFWFLHRISPYIGLALYVCYSLLLILHIVEPSKEIVALLAFRGGSYLLELYVDYAIDLEIHYDISVGQIVRRFARFRGEHPDPILGGSEVSKAFQWSQCAWVLQPWHFNNEELSSDSRTPFLHRTTPYTHFIVMCGIGGLFLSPFIVFFGAVALVVFLISKIISLACKGTSNEGETEEYMWNL